MGAVLQKCTNNILQNPAEKCSYNRRLFGFIAPSYDRITRILSFGRDQSWKRTLVAKLPYKDNCRILDVACGTGDLTAALSKKYSSGLIVGVDLTAEMILLAKRKCDLSTNFQIHDFSKLAFLSDSFDILTGGYALRNAPDLNEALLEFKRVLKNGGIAAFLDFSKSPDPRIQKVQYYLLVMWGYFWGMLFHGNPRFYTYIARSLRFYPDRSELRCLMTTCGYRVLETVSLFSGMAEIIICQKI